MHTIYGIVSNIAVAVLPNKPGHLVSVYNSKTHDQSSDGGNHSKTEGREPI